MPCNCLKNLIGKGSLSVFPGSSGSTAVVIHGSEASSEIVNYCPICGRRVNVMEYKVVMPYIGGILSENSYKFLTKRTKPMVRFWMKEVEDKVKKLGIPITDRYRVTVSGRFTDERRPDISNLFKVVSDSLQAGLGINDKNFLLVDGGYTLGAFDPEIVVEIELEAKIE